jgi:hypothetical protein
MLSGLALDGVLDLDRDDDLGQDADAVKLLSHHGKFWAFDTAGLPDDGTL